MINSMTINLDPIKIRNFLMDIKVKDNLISNKKENNFRKLKVGTEKKKKMKKSKKKNIEN